jgi:hypothetical protein
MRKLAHIVNPVLVGESSDLFYAQPITFATMKAARQAAAATVEVELLTTQYPEDHPVLPEGFRATPDLERSVQDVARFGLKRKLPLLKDILDRLYAATDAEYLAYANVDIALMPYFYTAVSAWLDQGFDALVINRRTISATYTACEQIPLMYSELGRKHEGHDCFVFRREAYPSYALAEVCIGIPWVGRVLIWNLACHAAKFQELTDEHLTFHVGAGNEKTLLEPEYADYRAYNRGEAAKAKAALESRGVRPAGRSPFETYPLDFYLGEPPRRGWGLARLLRR